MGLEGRSISILGAGIGGLAAAVALSLRGASVQVFERATVLGEVGGGLQIGPNGTKVLRALGVEPSASRPDAVELRDYRQGRLVARVPMGDIAEARYGAPYNQVHRADLVEALVTRATGLGVDIRLGSDVTDIAEDGTLGLGPDRISADLLVAADGIRSLTRSRLFSGEPPVFTGQVAWRATVPAERIPDLPAATCVFMGPGRHLVTYPLRGGSLRNIVAVEERRDWTEEGWSHPANPETLRAAFTGWCEPVIALTTSVEECHLWGLFTHPELPLWQNGRVALLGDACHPMLPFLAQGAGMALEDAWVLADCLDHEAQPVALTAYEAKRKPRATRVQRASAANAGVYHFRVPVLRQGLHLGMRVVSGVMPERLLGRFDWVYGEDVTV